MEDLFAREQTILNQALSRISNGAPCSSEEYAALAKEYQKLLKQLRRVTKISDRTTVDLNTRKLDLLDKVRFDGLTGIYNRRFLEERVCGLLRSISDKHGILSILMIDIDFFKQYNDTYGHNQGDHCLRAIAEAIKECISRPEDFVARYGGEEFVVVLPGSDAQAARIFANRILEVVRACEIPHKKNLAANCVTVSIGVTTGKVDPSHTMEEYIQAADKALYLSKQNGRNQSTFIKLQEVI